MNGTATQSLWKNFAASIDMLINIIQICPAQTWQKEKKMFYMTYHTIIFLDYYLTRPVREFDPILPYTITDEDCLPDEAVDDVIPNEWYDKEDLLSYLDAVRQKCKRLITETPPDQFGMRWIEDDEIGLHGLCPTLVTNYSLIDILFYNLRHVQHHVAQLNAMLRQNAGIATDWISHAE